MPHCGSRPPQRSHTLNGAFNESCFQQVGGRVDDCAAGGAHCIAHEQCGSRGCFKPGTAGPHHARHAMHLIVSPTPALHAHLPPFATASDLEAVTMAAVASCVMQPCAAVASSRSSGASSRVAPMRSLSSSRALAARPLVAGAAAAPARRQAVAVSAAGALGASMRLPKANDGQWAGQAMDAVAEPPGGGWGGPGRAGWASCVTRSFAPVPWCLQQQQPRRSRRSASS